MRSSVSPLALPPVDADWASWLRGYGESQLAAVDAGAATVRSARTDTMAPADVVAAWDETGRRLRLAAAAGELFSSVHPQAHVRDLADDLAAQAARVATELGQDEQIHAVLSALPTATLTEQQRRFLAHEVRDFRRSGIGLAEDVRTRLRELSEQETVIRQRFDNTIRDDVRTVSVKPEDLDGLPQDWLDAHPVGEDGMVTVTTDSPDLQPVLSFARKRKTRKALRAAASQRGWPENEQTLAELVAVRTERARLLGFATWPAFDADVKMIGSAPAIGEFVDTIADAVRPAADAEYDELFALLREDHPKAKELTVADTGYYTERLRRERHDVDAQQVRRYFDFATVRDGVLDVVTRLFGLGFTPVADAPVWHEDATAYDVTVDGAPLGRVYLDLHPRDGKFKHAALFELVAGVSGVAAPEGVLVCNFPRGLMEHAQVVTFFHEFGHLVHHLVAGQGAIARFSGISTEWDFVEAPSQMFEEWAWDPQILATFARDEDGEPIPAALVERMRRAKDVGRGLHVAAQMYYAAVSYRFYEKPSANLSAQRAKLRAKYYRPADLPDTHFHTSFGHLSGYSSAYYTYMWSLVIAKDLFSAFDSADLLAPQTARRYRDMVLAPGGSEDAARLVESFLGRPYDERAFTSWLAG